MKLQTLHELNAERAARRPAIVVTDVASGEQRLVKARDLAADPLQAELSKQLRMGKSGTVEVGGKKPTRFILEQRVHAHGFRAQQMVLDDSVR